MAERELGILVRAKGAAQAAKDIGKVDSAVGRLGSIGKKAASNLTTNLTRVGVVAGGFLASQVFFGVQSLEKIERVMNATNAVIESTGGVAGVTADEVVRLAEGFERVTTAEAEAVQSGQNMLLTFTNIGADVFPAASKAMVDMAIAMAEGDVEAANFKDTAIQVGKALNDPVRGFTALRRVGVSFTADQEKQIKAMVKAGKTADAQRLIIAELEREFGKAGEAAGEGFGGDMRRFGHAVGAAQEALAKGLIPVIQRVSTFLTTKLNDPATIAALEEGGRALADLFEQGLAAAEKIPWASIGDAMRIAGTGAKAALDFFTGLPPWVQTAVLTGWGLNKLTGGAVGDLVGELGKGLIKGVLGMNAGVVNINAGVVRGGGGAPLPGGGGGGGGRGKPSGGGGKLRPLPLLGPAGLITAPLVLAGDTPQGKPNETEFITELRKMFAAGRGNERISDTETVAQALRRLTGSLPGQKEIKALGTQQSRAAAEAQRYVGQQINRASQSQVSATGSVTSAVDRQREISRNAAEAARHTGRSVERGNSQAATASASIKAAIDRQKSATSAVESALRNLKIPTPNVSVQAIINTSVSLRDINRKQRTSQSFHMRAL